jgi:hypothetical protein
MALGSTQPVREMSTSDFPGGIGLTISKPSVSRLSRKFGSLDVSHPYGPSQLVMLPPHIAEQSPSDFERDV